MTHSTPTQHRYGIPAAATVVGFACFALLAGYAIFSLPYRFPPRHRLVSASYVFGFNNSVAILSVVTLLGFATVVNALHRRRQHRAPDLSFPQESPAGIPRVPGAVYLLMALLYLLLTAVMYRRAQATQFYGIDWESSHFLWRLKLMGIYGLRPYTDFHSEYGPALAYLPAYVHGLLSPWSVSYEASYYVSHYLVNLFGLFCIFALLNRAVAPSRYKTIAFVILALASFAPYMGLNGVAARFLVPYLSLVLINQALARAAGTQSRWRLLGGFLFGFLATVLNVSISAEIGVAFSLALLAFGVASLRVDPRAGFVLLSACALALVLGRVLLPAAYYESLFSFSKGANNLPLLPAAHLLFYTVTLFLAVPHLLATPLLRKRADAPLLFALGTLSVVLIPGAFGRSDPPHVLFYGLGISLLTFLLLANAGRTQFLLYAVAYIGVFIAGLQWSNARVFYEWSLRDLLLRATALGTEPAGGVGGEESPRRERKPGTEDDLVGEFPPLGALDKYPRLGLPFGSYGADKVTANYLWMRKKVAPEYYVGAVGVYTEADLSRKLADVSRNEFLLVRNGWYGDWNRDVCAAQRKYLRLAFIYPVTLPCKHEGLDPDAEIARYIAASYQPVEEIGDYVVLKRTEPSAAG